MKRRGSGGEIGASGGAAFGIAVADMK